MRRLKRGDVLRIGDVTLTVRTATTDVLRLAIEAPREMMIDHISGGQAVIEQDQEANPG